MKVCVVGTGAIGGLLGARLAHVGHSVSLLARGAQLAAIQRHGLKLIQDGESLLVKNAHATDNIAQLGCHDVVLLAVKSHQIAALAAQLPNLLAPNGVLVTLQNGIPWWYFQKLNGKYANRTVAAVDPDGLLARTLDAERILGCSTFVAAIVSQPGVIQHLEGAHFPLGELDGADSERAHRVARMFVEAGFKAPVLTDIRAEIWLKLWGNLCFNPLSALTHATLEGICQFPLSRELMESMMREAQQVAEKLGVRFRVTLQRRIAGAERVGKHKTSMLQDVEAGKPLEIDSLLGAVVEMAEITNTETPALRMMYACVSLLNETLVKQRVAIQSKPLQ